MLSLISPLPLLMLPSSIISAGARWILQPYRRGLSRCCMKTHISPDPCGDSFLQTVPRQQTGRAEPRECPPSDALPAMPSQCHRLTPATAPCSTPCPSCAENPELGSSPSTAEPSPREGQAGQPWGGPLGIALLTAKPRWDYGCSLPG